MTTKQLLSELDGQEVWVNLNRFEERVCIGIGYPSCICGGKMFKPTKTEAEEIFKAYMIQELGSDSQQQKALEDEFGKLGE